MLLWNSDLQKENYGKNIYSTKLSYYGKNYGTIPKYRFKKGEKTMVDYQKRRNFDLLWKKNYVNKRKQLKMLNMCIALDL